MEGKTQETAAAMAGMSVRSARKWQRGPMPSETKQERRWRTRPDPFDGVWEDEIKPLLRGDPGGRLKATTIIEWLEEEHPGRFSPSQLRTLQRRLQDWRALHGPDQEVYFPQEHPPGREAQIDFTHGNALGVTIAGQRYPHLLFQLILSHSRWRYAEVATGETFLALKQGLQAALWTLGGVPEVVRSDNTSAATHEVRHSRGRALNDNYAALLDHYGLCSTRINRGQSHENGVAEQAHHRLKDAIDQALILRGSRDFDTVDDYASFVREMVAKRNRLVEGKLEQEKACLRPLPPAPVPEYVNYQARAHCLNKTVTQRDWLPQIKCYPCWLGSSPWWWQDWRPSDDSCPSPSKASTWTTTAYSSTRRSPSTALSGASSSPVPGRSARTTRPGLSRRTARWSATA